MDNPGKSCLLELAGYGKAILHHFTYMRKIKKSNSWKQRIEYECQSIGEGGNEDVQGYMHFMWKIKNFGDIMVTIVYNSVLHTWNFAESYIKCSHTHKKMETYEVMYAN